MENNRANQEVKHIRLVADVPFHNNVDLAICDFGGPQGALRQRGKITVDYAEYDINQLKAQGIQTLSAALDYYKDTIYKTVRRYLLTEFALEEGGWDHILDLVENQIKQYFPEENHPEDGKQEVK